MWAVFGISSENVGQWQWLSAVGGFQVYDETLRSGPNPFSHPGMIMLLQMLYESLRTVTSRQLHALIMKRN